MSPFAATDVRKWIFMLSSASLIFICIFTIVEQRNSFVPRTLAVIRKPLQTTTTRVQKPMTVKRIYLATNLFNKRKNWNSYFPAWSTLSPTTCDDGAKCQWTTDHGQADALLFHGRETGSANLSHLLKYRKSHQRWVFFSWESITNSKLNFSDKWYRQFNWTATYMRNSDSWAPYFRGYLPLNALEVKKSEQQPLYNVTEKTGMAVAVISNCNPKTRMKVIKSLQRYMEVRVFGRCGQSLKRGLKDLLQLTRQYRFYLAFENSRCRDYITEKFWANGLMGNAIPVVFGGFERKDYASVAPPHSFVYANDFSTVKDLSVFLKRLAANESEYAKYFEWKRKWRIDPYDMKMILMCGICKKLHTDEGHKTVDITSFWNQKLYCHSKNNF